MLCRDIGYRAILEHHESRADVWVESIPPLAIEIQRWKTNFKDREEKRKELGAQVLWLIPEDADKEAGQQLFRHPAARIRVSERENRRKEARPWVPGYSGRVLLWIGATVMKPSADNRKLISGGNYDARKFLREVIEQRRRWVGPNAHYISGGAGWVLEEDLVKVQGAQIADYRNQVAPTAKTPSIQTSEFPPARATPGTIDQPVASELQMAERRVVEPEPETLEAPLHQPCTIAETLPGPAYPGASSNEPPTRKGYFLRLKDWLNRMIERISGKAGII
ncbi:hypothetical protein [Devriesea agamarum]|uniref:hypothetical protein n=1 Tax=Devriesea agamarum TaxID=472569 RepID=UPI0012EDDE0A|nr:hypothetical protein [Devriesea agamarum]